MTNTTLLNTGITTAREGVLSTRYWYTHLDGLDRITFDLALAMAVARQPELAALQAITTDWEATVIAAATANACS